jgi:hypothetical protein
VVLYTRCRCIFEANARPCQSLFRDETSSSVLHNLEKAAYALLSDIALVYLAFLEHRVTRKSPPRGMGPYD